MRGVIFSSHRRICRASTINFFLLGTPRNLCLLGEYNTTSCSEACRDSVFKILSTVDLPPHTPSRAGPDNRPIWICCFQLLRKFASLPWKIPKQGSFGVLFSREAWDLGPHSGGGHLHPCSDWASSSAGQMGERRGELWSRLF